MSAELQTILIIQHRVFLVLAREKIQRETRKMRDSQHLLQCHSEENLWSFISRLQQQQLNSLVEANMLYRLLSPTYLSPHAPTLPACLVIFSHICDSQNLTSPLPGQLSDWLPYLLFNVVRNAATLPRVTALRLNLHLTAWQKKKKEAKVGRKDRNGALSCTTGVRKRKTGGIWGQRRGKKGRSLIEDLPFWGCVQRGKKDSQRALKHILSRFPPSLTTLQCTKTKHLTAADRTTAGGEAEGHGTCSLCICLACAHPSMKSGLQLLYTWYVINMWLSLRHNLH